MEYAQSPTLESKVPVADLVRLTEIRDLDRAVLAAAAKGVDIYQKTRWLSLSTEYDKLSVLSQETSAVGNNTVFYINSEDPKADPLAVIKVMDTLGVRKNSNPFGREVSAIQLLNQLDQDTVVFPKLIGFDKDSGVVVSSFIPDNVVKRPDLLLQGYIDIISTINSVKPTGQFIDTFPHPRLNALDNPEKMFEQTITSRLLQFNNWLDQIKNGQVGDSSSETEKYIEFARTYEQLGLNLLIAEKLNRVRLLFSQYGNEFFDSKQQSLTLGDGNLSNIILQSKTGELKKGMIDFEATEFGDPLYQVALMVNNPANRLMIGDQQNFVAHMSTFLNNYSAIAKLDSVGQKKLSIFVEITDLAWLSTVARNIAFTRKGWTAAGGAFSRPEYLLAKELPLLTSMCESNPLKISEGLNNHRYSQSKSLGFEVLKHPFKEGVPVGRYERWVSELVGDKAYSWLNKSNQELRAQKVAHLFKASEMFSNNPYILGPVADAQSLGSGYKLILHEFWSMRAPSNESGMYGYLTRTRDKDRNTGGLMFVTTNERIKNNKGIERIYVDRTALDDFKHSLGSGLTPRMLSLLGNLEKNTKDNTDSVKVTRLEILNDLGDFFTIVVAYTDDGRRLPILVNREGKEFGEASAVIYVPQLETGKYRMIRKTNVITPDRKGKNSGRKEAVELPRAFVSNNEVDLSELVDEIGEANMEILSEGGFNQSWETDFVNIKNISVKVSESGPVTKVPILSGMVDDYYEETKTIDLTGEEALLVLEDEYSIYALGQHMLNNSKELVLDTEASKDKFIFLEKRFVIQAGEEKLVMPRSKKGKGDLVNTLAVNPTSDRMVDEVQIHENINGITNKDAILVTLPVEEVLDLIKQGSFDSPTGSALILGMVKAGLLKYQNPIQI